MRIDFKFKELNEVFKEHNELLSSCEPKEANDESLNFCMCGFGIAIPELKIELRDADMLDEENSDNPFFAMPTQVTLIYKEGEEDLNNILNYIAGDFKGAIYEHVKKSEGREISDEEIDELDCYIEAEENPMSLNMYLMPEE